MRWEELHEPSDMAQRRFKYEWSRTWQDQPYDFIAVDGDIRIGRVHRIPGEERWTWSLNVWLGNRTADQWMELCDRGLVNLLQRRIGRPGGRFEYVAVRTTAPVSETQRVHEAIVNGRNTINRLIDTA